MLRTPLSSHVGGIRRCHLPVKPIAATPANSFTSTPVRANPLNPSGARNVKKGSGSDLEHARAGEETADVSGAGTPAPAGGGFDQR